MEYISVIISFKFRVAKDQLLSSVNLRLFMFDQLLQIDEKSGKIRSELKCLISSLNSEYRCCDVIA